MEIDWEGWVVFGLVATAVLSAVMIGAQATHWTRLDVPMMLGTVFVGDPDRARLAGFFAHLCFGQVFAFGYAASFAALDGADPWIGAALGAVHATVALGVLVPLLPAVNPRMGSSRAGPSQAGFLEPPGFFAMNYGVHTPAVTFVAHVAFGFTLGLVLGP